MLPQSIEPRRMIAEIGLLIDYISGRGTRTFLAKPPPDYSGKMADKLGEDPIWEFLRICSELDLAVNCAPHPPTPESLQREALACEKLVLTRDWLNSIANPVTGDTIAFSILVGRFKAGRLSHDEDAIRAFPTYGRDAAKMVMLYHWLRSFAFCLTALISITSAWTIFGYMALGSLADLRTRTELLEHELATKEATINARRAATSNGGGRAAGSVPSPIAYIRYCGPDLDKFLREDTSAYEILDSEQISFCGHRSDLGARRDSAYQTLNFWMLGGLPRFGFLLKPNACDARNAVESDAVGKELGNPAPKKVSCNYVTEAVVTISDDSARAWVAVVGGCILPLLMAMWGSTVAVLREYVQNIRERLLAPRDRRLYQIRWTLGIVAGAAVGFFFAPTSPALSISAVSGSATSGAIASAAALASTTNLSAPALGFIAGFAVDLFFQFLGGAAQLLLQRRQQS